MQYKQYEILSLDFETFYSKDYTLKKMSTSLYIFDDRFLTHGVGVTYKGKSQWLHTDQQIRTFFATVDWPNTALLAHHCQFDALILSYHYGCTPGYYLCTLSMARPLLANVIKKLSIDSIAKYLGVGGKIDGLQETKDKRILTITEMKALGKYCVNDVVIMIGAYTNMILHFPEFEMDIIDWHIRMYAENKFVVDAKLAEKEVDNAINRKQKMFDNVRTLFPPELQDSQIPTISVLRSAPSLSKVIEHNGFIVPTKTSPTTGKTVPAFARTDLAFKKFLISGDPTQKLLYEARIESKSDTALNKAKMLVQLSTKPMLPVYLNYGKAVTLRSSGGDKLQLQNLPRGGNARKCMRAPPGKQVVSIDSSGIELRVALWLSGQEDKLQLVRDGEDLYIHTAADLYNKPREDITTFERMIGKVTILSCQYGAGLNTFDTMLRQGSMGPPVDMSPYEVETIHKFFRRSFDKIVGMWSKCNNFLYAMSENIEYEHPPFKDIYFEKGRAYTHEGMYLNYNELRSLSDGSFQYQGPNGIPRKMYGSLFFNNLCQHIARNIVYRQINEVAKKYDPQMAVHDEVSVIEDIAIEAEVKDYLLKCFTTTPEYCSDLPLDADFAIGAMYSK